MNRIPAAPPRGRAPPVLVLCRQCVQYVSEGTVTCPHCGGDARATGARYEAGGYLSIETIQRIQRVAERVADQTNSTARPDRSGGSTQSGPSAKGAPPRRDA